MTERERAGTVDEVAREFTDRVRSDVKTIEARIHDTRRETRDEMQHLREANNLLRDRITALETKFGAFHEWHRPAFDAVIADVKRIDRLVLMAVGAGAAGGGTVALVAKIIGGM